MLLLSFLCSLFPSPKVMLMVAPPLYTSSTLPLKAQARLLLLLCLRFIGISLSCLEWIFWEIIWRFLLDLLESWVNYLGGSVVSIFSSTWLWYYLFRKYYCSVDACCSYLRSRSVLWTQSVLEQVMGV